MREERMWNVWHGCHKKSEGCLNCYVYRRDAAYGIDSTIVRKTASFPLPIKRNRSGNYTIPQGTRLWTCFTSDFFLEEADPWDMMRERCDLLFCITTKRPERIAQCLPHDWGKGYAHIHIACTMENQKRTDERILLFRDLPIMHKAIICEPLLGPIAFRGKLGPWCEKVIVGGESGPHARLCDYAWVLAIRSQCIDAKIAFTFKQTGALFRKEGRIYRIKRSLQASQAARACINWHTNEEEG